MNKRVLIPLIGTLLVIGTTVFAIQFAKGYRPNLQTGGLAGTGLLVANSFPDGAQVFINGKLTTATDETLNLTPGDYQIEIRKDGFTSWKKTLVLKAELVTQTNATLFSSVPTLKPLTFTGALNPTPSPDGQKIVFFVQNSANPAKNGLWVLELSGMRFIRTKEPRQISRSLGIDFSQEFASLRLTWSPDSQEVLLSSPDANYLLDASRFNDQGDLQDVTARLSVIFSDWEASLARKELEQLLLLPPEMQLVATASATNLYFSPDEEKLLYTAKAAATIPEDLVPPLPAESTQAEERSLEPGATYVYDLKEDKNFRVLGPPPAELGQEITEKILLVEKITQLPSIFTNRASLPADATQSALQAGPSANLKLQENKTVIQTSSALNAQYSPLPVQNIQWFPTSNHLILTANDQVIILEYDGTNRATIYANSFEGNFVYPWPTGSELLILTNLSQQSDLPPNLYSINLK